MIVSDVITRVRRTFGDESSVQVTNEDVFRWVNDCQREAVMQNIGLLEKISVSSLVAGQNAYDLPSDFSWLQEVRVKISSDTSYFTIPFMPLKQFSEYIDGWDGDFYGNSQPSVYTEQEGKIILFPTPAISNADGLKIRYSRYPTDVTGENDAIDLPLYYHNMVVNYCMMNAYEMDEDIASAAAKANLVQTDLNMNRGRNNYAAQDTYPVIQPLPEDMY